MTGIFISYRRDDSQRPASRLADDLGDILGLDRVFRDIEIPIGSDFTDVLRRVSTVAVVLALVYFGIRLFGNEPILSGLNAFEARLRIGWDRLQAFVASS